MTEAGAADHGEPLYFDDLAVGRQFTSGTFQLDPEQVQTYAQQFDPQPFHTDPVAAKDSFFGELVASGWHTAGITMRLLVQSGLKVAGGLIGAGAEIAWPRPTPPDALLHVESEVIEARISRSQPARGIVTIRSETKDQEGNTVQVLTAKLVVPRRTSG